MPSLTTETKDKILTSLKAAVEQPHFDRWLKGLDFIDTGDNTIEVPLPNVYYRQLYEKSYAPHIQKALQDALGQDYKLKFLVQADTTYPNSEQLGQPGLPFGDKQPEAQPAESTPATATPATARGEPPRTGVRSNSHHNDDLKLNAKYIFERFIIGQCNRLAHAGALAVAENPGKSYNPLFIHGSVGLGKTHLLQAICHMIIARTPASSIIYRSCEGFVNDYIAGVKNGNLEEFRARYRSVDILVIDDIHFLGVGTKHASQEEFFHTFNALHNSQKQIIISSDSHPRDIPTLEDRLVSRFKWGMIAPLEPPDYETKAAILKSKAELNHIDIPDDVASFLATNINTNIRDLESVINYFKASATKIDINLGKKAFEAIVGIDVKHITIADIHNAIIAHFNVSMADLQSKKRTRPVATARQVGIYLARSFNPNYSLDEIGSAFGGRDHSTVLHSIEITRQRLHKDKQFKATIDLITSELKRAH